MPCDYCCFKQLISFYGYSNRKKRSRVSPGSYHVWRPLSDFRAYHSPSAWRAIVGVSPGASLLDARLLALVRVRTALVWSSFVRHPHWGKGSKLILSSFQPMKDTVPLASRLHRFLGDIYLHPRFGLCLGPSVPNIFSLRLFSKWFFVVGFKQFDYDQYRCSFLRLLWPGVGWAWDQGYTFFIQFWNFSKVFLQIFSLPCPWGLQLHVYLSTWNFSTVHWCSVHFAFSVSFGWFSWPVFQFASCFSLQCLVWPFDPVLGLHPTFASLVSFYIFTIST